MLQISPLKNERWIHVDKSDLFLYYTLKKAFLYNIKIT